MSRAASFAFALLLVGVSLGACAKDEPSPIPGVRLGMAPRDVRDRFEGGDKGTWQTRVGTADDTALEWTARAPSPVASARFEFHNGMLVALRARLTEPGPATDETTATRKTVTLRAKAPEGGTSVTVLVRDCPTHREEAESLAKRAGASGSPR